MTRQMTPFRILKVLVGTLIISQLAACGGGDGGNSNAISGGSASAGTVTAQSSAFSLSWVAPVTRSDGTPISLAEIEGFRVYYGTSTGNYTDTIDITDGSQTSATITGLASGTYYVAMTTYDNQGLESAYSPEIVKATP